MGDKKKFFVFLLDNFVLNGLEYWLLRILASSERSIFTDSYIPPHVFDVHVFTDSTHLATHIPVVCIVTGIVVLFDGGRESGEHRTAQR